MKIDKTGFLYRGFERYHGKAPEQTNLCAFFWQALAGWMLRIFDLSYLILCPLGLVLTAFFIYLLVAYGAWEKPTFWSMVWMGLLLMATILIGALSVIFFAGKIDEKYLMFRPKLRVSIGLLILNLVFTLFISIITMLFIATNGGGLTFFEDLFSVAPIVFVVLPLIVGLIICIATGITWLFSSEFGTVLKAYITSFKDKACPIVKFEEYSEKKDV